MVGKVLSGQVTDYPAYSVNSSNFNYFWLVSAVLVWSLVLSAVISLQDLTV